jgi:CRP-like cAMP-binding protein
MSEVQQMIADPSLMGNAAVEAARKYESGRQEVLEQLAVYGSSSIDGPSSTTTDAGKVATFGREWLRQLADELIIEYPQFGEMYRNVYSYEVANVHDAPKPPIIDVFGEGDIFGELGLAS